MVSPLVYVSRVQVNNFSIAWTTEFMYYEYDQVHFESFNSIGRFMSH